MSKKKVKAEIDKKGRLTFLEDEDGVSERDYLILITSWVFFGGIALGLIVTLIGMFFGFTLPNTYIELVKVMDIPIATIVGGLFTVKTAQTIVQRKSNGNTESEITVDINNEEEDVY